MSPEVKLGIYRHWKGHLYQVIGIASDANADKIGDHAWLKREQPPRKSIRSGISCGIAPFGDRIVVVYIGLQVDGARPGPRMHVRTIEDFTAWVDPVTGEEKSYMPWLGAELVQRFTYLGQEFTPEVAALMKGN